MDGDIKISLITEPPLPPGMDSKVTITMDRWHCSMLEWSVSESSLPPEPDSIITTIMDRWHCSMLEWSVVNLITCLQSQIQ